VVTGGSGTGGAVTGGAVTGGAVTGGAVTGGAVTGGIAGAGTGGLGAGGNSEMGGALTQEECDALEAQYRDVVAEAQQCNPTYSAPSCLETASDYIACGCEVPVNGQNADALEQLAFLQIEFTEGECVEPSICLMGGACLVWTSADCTLDGTCGVVE
jgi:hypothetical protein